MGNLDSLVLELFSRVKSLEKKVEMLEGTLSQQHTQAQGNVEEEESQGKITRSVARQYVMNKISDLDPSINVQKGNRSTPGDLIIKGNDGSLNAKLYYSKSHIKQHLSSWHTIKVGDIVDNNVDLHIFTVSYEGNFHTFLFTTNELRDFIKDKDSGNAELYHFYFHKLGDRFLEVRDGEKNVEKYYERWNIVQDLL